MELKKEWVWNGDEWNDGDEEFEIHTRRSFLLVPGCCEESIAAMRPYMKLKFDDGPKNIENAIPEWLIPELEYSFASTFFKDGEKYNGIGFKKYSIPVKFCPYCGKQLPKLRIKEKLPEPLYSDDYEHCKTCGERDMECNCWPLEAAFEVER